MRLRLACAPPQVSNTLTAATSWSRLGAFRIPPELDSRRPALNWTGAVTFASMTDWRQVRQTYGPSGNALVVHNSHTYPKTIFASYVTIWQEEIAAPASGSFPIACSLIPRSLVSGLAKAKRNAKASSPALQGCRWIPYLGR